MASDPSWAPRPATAVLALGDAEEFEKGWLRDLVEPASEVSVAVAAVFVATMEQTVMLINASSDMR